MHSLLSRAGIDTIDSRTRLDKDRHTATSERTPAAFSEGVSRFELAPPRRFILPAILLLLSEQPGYGYGLAPRLESLQFGHVDRPAIYRALAQLEQDGLIDSSTDDGVGGQSRRMYLITPSGERVLRAWMGVVTEEHQRLGQVVRRYQATRTPDAMLAEAESGWSGVLPTSWSRISPIVPSRQQLGQMPTNPARPFRTDAHPVTDIPSTRRTFTLDPERSAVLIDVRSTVGPMTFGTLGVQGVIEVAMRSGTLHTDVPPRGWLQFDVRTLRSGNRLYDGELFRRIDARRFPHVRVDLEQCTACGPGARYNLTGEIAFHGVSRRAEGTVSINGASSSRLSIHGEQSFDIRDFAVPSPSVLMLRIYPDLRVRLQVEAVAEDES